MSLVPISLGQGSSQTRYGAAGLTRHLNCYLEVQGEDAKHPSMIVASDGLSSFATLTNGGAVRAGIEVGGYGVVVSGRLVFRVDRGGGSTLLGGIPTDGPVYIRSNRRTYPQVGIVSSGLFYCIDTSTWTMTQVTDSDLPPATSLAFLDGYGILPVSRGRWFITGLDDFTTIDALDVAEAESDADDIVVASERDGEIVLFGDRSIEWWQDTGGSDFPFTRSQAIHIGCSSAGSVCKINRTLAWVDHNGVVRLMNGYDGERISEHGVERDIADVEPSTLMSTTWSRGGHTFYSLTAPGYWTRVYNLTTGKWHDRASYGDNHWKVSTVFKLGTLNIAGDGDTGLLYDMSPDYYSEGSDPLVMDIITPPVHASPMRLVFNSVYVDIIPGVGLTEYTEEGGEEESLMWDTDVLMWGTDELQWNTAATVTASSDNDPVVLLAWSDNGGKTWSGERSIAIGELGDYTRRAVTRRIGTGKSVGRTFRIRISASVAKAIQAMWADVEKLAA